MNGLYDILESYKQQNDPRFIYEGLYEQPAYTGPNIDPMYNLGARQFGNMQRMDFGVPLSCNRHHATGTFTKFRY